MNFTKVIVATTGGEVRAVTGEMRKLMQEGFKRKLTPLKDFKKPLLELDTIAKHNISTCKRNIKRLLWEMSKLENQKTKYGISKSEVASIEAKIEQFQFEIFEQQEKIRNIKINCYKNQTSGLNYEV